MFYLILLLLSLTIFNILIVLKLSMWVNTMKYYQYTNNLKLMGFIKREIRSILYEIRGDNAKKENRNL